MSPTRLTVRAIVVADGRAPQLFAALEAVLAQDPAPDAIHLLLTGEVPPPEVGWNPRIDVRQIEAESWGEAVRVLLADSPASPHELLWLLHDDMAPLPGTLAALMATARKRQRAGVIGAAHVRWDDASRLVNLGTTTSRVGARRLGLVQEEDVNQGQYDDREDVLAVSLGGALVRRSVWDRLDGIDPGCDGWSESLNFCRRTWRSGWDVVTVPTAKVRHSQESLYGRRGGSGGGRRSTYSLRRASEWYHALTFAPWWAVLALMVWTVLSAVARAVLRIAQNDPRLFLADLLVPWRVLAQASGLPGSRKRVRRAGRAGRAAERELLAGTRQIIHQVRAAEFGARDRRRAAAVPSDVVAAELLIARKRRRTVLAGLSVALTAFCIAWRPGWLAGIISGDMLAGGVLGVTDVSASTLWARATTGWTEQALGAPAVDAGLSALLLPLAAVPGGLAVGLGLLMVTAPLTAGLAAWAAAGVFTRSLAARALSAVLYGLWPASLMSLEQGRIGAVIAHVLLPWVVLGLARAGGWQRAERIGDGEEHRVRPPSSSAAMGAALALGLSVASAPVLLLPAVVVVGVLGAFSGSSRWRIWGTLIPAGVASAPGLIAAWHAGPWSADAAAILAREPGPSATATLQSSVDLLTGVDAGMAGLPHPLSVGSRALFAALVAGAVVAAIVGRRRLLSALALVSAAAGLGTAVFVQGVTLSPAAGSGSSAGSGWYGPGLSVVAVAVLVLLCSATADVWFGAEGRLRAWRRGGAIVMTALLALGTAGSAVAQVWPSREPVGDVGVVSRDVLPLVAALEQRTVDRQRVLALTETEDGIDYAVLSADGADVLTSAASLTADGSPAARRSSPPVPGAAHLGEAVAGLVTSSDAAAGTLAQWGVGVVLTDPASAGVAEALSQTPGISLMGASERGTSWRIGSAEGEGRVARAWFEAGDQVVNARTWYARGEVTAPGPGTLVLAMPADPAWSAALDGSPLAPVDDAAGRQVFAVGGAGQVAFEYDDRGYRAWFWAAVVTFGWVAIASIPARTRQAAEDDEQ